MADLEAAWEAVRAATPAGWRVGPANLHDEMGSGQWEQYAWDPSERPNVGVRSREWTAVGETELDCLVEMARCLREIAAGRVPKYLVVSTPRDGGVLTSVSNPAWKRVQQNLGTLAA